MKKCYAWFKKAVGVAAYLYWIPFFYGVKSGHTLYGLGEISSAILLFFVGIMLSMGFLGMCKHDPVDKEAVRLKELYVEEVPANLRVVTTWFCQVVIGVALSSPLQIWLITGLLFILLWKINWWIFNPVFLFWNIHFCKVKQVINHEAFYFMMPVELKDTHHKVYLHCDEYKICSYGSPYDWIAFSTYR